MGPLGFPLNVGEVQVVARPHSLSSAFSDATLGTLSNASATRCCGDCRNAFKRRASGRPLRGHARR